MRFIVLVKATLEDFGDSAEIERFRKLEAERKK